MRHVLLAAACLGLLACSRPDAPPTVLSAPVPARGKLVAPVSVTASVGAKGAQVTLRFEGPATGASAGVRGLDGLALAEAPALAPRAYRAGETVTLQVPLASTDGTLVVSVDGTFGGLAMSRTVTFALGAQASKARLGADQPGVVQTDLGPIRAMPAATGAEGR